MTRTSTPIEPSPSLSRLITLSIAHDELGERANHFRKPPMLPDLGASEYIWLPRWWSLCVGVRQSQDGAN